jgi:ferrochelatase
MLGESKRAIERSGPVPARQDDPAPRPPGSEAATGVVLANLGSPDAPTPAAVRRYLAQFLSDPRVVKPPPPRWLWWLILHGIVLRVRPARVARHYARVWTPEGSPLIAISRRQGVALEALLRERHAGPIHVAVGMRYGEPSIGAALRELRERGCRRILTLPAYPQSSGPTTVSTLDAVAAELARWREPPEMRFRAGYHDHPGYIAALAASAREAWSRQGGEPDKLLISFHGLPLRYAEDGDPYPGQCHATARLVAEALGLAEGRWAVAFQSRFGRERWLEPDVADLLRDWARQGAGRVDAICPGFSADCLETLDEVAIGYRELFLAKGGKAFRYIPALNDRADHVAALADVASAAMAGWMAPRQDAP